MKKIVFYLSLFILVWVYCVKFNCIDWDMWARLTVGKVFYLTGAVLQQDIFAYTPIKDLWIDHEWGSSLIFYYISHYFGDTGLILLKIFLNFTILFLISRIVKSKNPSVNSHTNILFYMIIYLLMFGGIGSTVRCHQFTFLFFTLMIYLLEKVRKGKDRYLYLIPIIMLIWTNLHGGFVSGLGLLAIYGFGEFLNKRPFKKYFITLIPTVLVTLINPYGLNYWYYILEATTMKRPNITEWMSTNLFGSILSWKGFKVVFVISLTSVIFSFIKNRPKYKDLDKVKYLLLGVTLYLALKHIKHQPFFGIVAGSFLYHDFYNIFFTIKEYIICRFGEKWEKILKNAALVKNVILYSFIIVGGSLLMFSNPVNIVVPADIYPIGSVEFIRQNNLSGNLVTLFHWGSYATWKLYPNCKVALDGRYEEVYSNEIVKMVGDFIYNYDQKSLIPMKKLNTDLLLLDKTNDSYAKIVKDKYWRRVFEDDISGVFIRRDKSLKQFKIPVYTEKSVMEDKYKTSINKDSLGDIHGIKR
jgi:hypothetical protein